MRRTRESLLIIALLLLPYGFLRAQDCNGTCFDLYNERGEVLPGTSCQPDFKPQTIGGSTCLQEDKCIIFDNTFQVNPPETLYIFAWGDGVIDTLTHQQLLAIPEEENFIGKSRKYCHAYQEVTCPDPQATFTVDIDLLNPNGNCTNSAASGEIKVLAPVVVDFEVPEFICTNTPFAITNTSEEGYNNDCTTDAHYEWDYGNDGSVDETQDGKQPLMHPGFTTPGTKTIKLTGYHDPKNTCGPDDTVKTITVLNIPEPIFTIGEGAELTTVSDCKQENIFTFTPASNACLTVSLPLENITENRNPTTSFLWSVSQPAGATFQHSDLTTDTNIVTFSEAGEYKVFLAVTDNCADGLVGRNAACITVIVKDAPDISIEAPSPLCAGNPLVAAILSNGIPLDSGDIQSITWEIQETGGGTVPAFDNGGDSLIIDNIPQGTYEVSLTYENLCGTTTAAPVTIEVQPAPVINIAADKLSVCVNDVFTLTADDNTGDTYTWFEDDTEITGEAAATLIRAPDTPGTYTYYTTISKNGCMVTSHSVTVIVNASPSADPILADRTEFCSNETIAFTLEVQNINPPAAGLQWQSCVICDGSDWSEVAGANSATFSGNTAGSYRVQIDASGTCTALSDPITIQVTPPPTFQLDVADPIVCGGAPLTLTLQGGAQNYVWSPATGLNTDQGNTVIASPATTTEYTVTATTAAGCTNDTTFTITVLPAPDIQTTVSQPLICPGDTVTIQASQGVSYTWLPDPTLTVLSEDEAIAFPQSTTTYRVVGTNEQGCTDTAAVMIEVRSIPGLSTADESACLSDPAFSLSLALPGGVTGAWSAPQLPAGSLLPDGLFDPQVAGANPNGHAVTFTYQTDGGLACESFVTKRVFVHPLPVPAFSVPAVVCVGAEISLDNTTANDTGFTYEWKVESTVYTERSPTHTFQQTSDATTIWLYARTTEGCMDSVMQTIQVIEAPVVGFSKTVAPLSLCGPLTVTFTNESAGKFTTYAWDFGNGETSTEANPDAVVFQPGILGDTAYVITLSVINECTTVSATDTVRVKPPPVAYFLFERDTICAGFELPIHNYSMGLSETFEWYFGFDQTLVPFSTTGTGTFTQSFPYEGKADTTYYVTLVAKNGCGTDTLTRPLVVTPNTVEAFYNSNVLQGCSPLEVTLTSNQIAGTGNQVTFIWGDGDTTRSNVVGRHVYQTPGTYHPQMIVRNGCSIDACGGPDDPNCGVAVQVFPTPAASFEAPERICLTDSVFLGNTSASQINSAWDLGNGQTYQGTTPPPYTYTQSGTYTISLTTTNENGCQSAVYTREVVVNPLPVAAFTVADQPYCQDEPVQIRNASTGASAFEWIVRGLGRVSAEPDLNHAFSEAGTYELTLRAFSGEGNDRCSDSLTQTIQVSPPAEPSFAYTRDAGCGEDKITFTNRTIYPSAEEGTFTWDFGNGQTYSGSSKVPVQVYPYPAQGMASYTVTLTVQAQGCTQTYQQDIEVSPLAGVVLPEGNKPLAFTPNASENQLFKLQYRQVDEVNLRIYSREGVEVFQTSDPDKGWDGYYQGELAPAGLYNVQVSYQDCGGRSDQMALQLYLILEDF